MDLNENKPYVGVHVKRRVIDRKLNKQKKGRLQKMNQIANTNLYFFSDKDVNFEQKLINGTFFDTEEKKWTQADFPFPDVYYNRRSSNLNKGNIVDKIRNTFEEMGIPSINSQHCFDKWHVDQQLRQYEELRPHLPETRFCKNKKDLKKMFKKSSRVFLKALSKNNGIGIMCVTMNSEGYEYTRFGKSSLKTATFKNFNDLFKAIKLFYNGKPFIMQKAIDLIQLNDRTADIRSEIQRNGQGQLECVAHTIRLGTKNSPVTNTRTQSTIYPFDDFFKNKMGYTDDETTKLKKQLEKLLLYIYEKIELSYGAFGEIGIDFGLDKTGHLWFIECNVKTGKNTLRAHDKKTIDRAYLNPLEYAKFITREKQQK
ncbi:YheC/YheD family endospore coat-associated protein [Bacillus sp. GB_SG_008]|uniref:YheC/YheD family endospore coat-associated protein n=1 Tax=Bacillus sp. GB_SG_008 TaxID=3454627 RepID=UPI003F86811C